MAYSHHTPHGPPDISRAPTDHLGETSHAHWWLRMTSWQAEELLRDPSDQDRQRRSRVLGWLLLGLLVVDILLVIPGLSDPATLAGVVLGAAVLIVAALLNHAGRVSTAGWVLILLVDALIVATLVATVPSEAGVFTSGTLSMSNMPAYDLYLITLVVAAAVLRPRWIWVVMGLNCAVILLDYFAQPHTGELRTYELLNGGVVAGGLEVLARPLALQALIATVSALATSGLLAEIKRALNSDQRALDAERGAARREKLLILSVREHLQRVMIALGLPADTITPIRQHALARRFGLPAPPWRRPLPPGADDSLEAVLRDLDLCAGQAQLLPNLTPEHLALGEMMRVYRSVQAGEALPQALSEPRYTSAGVAELARILAELIAATRYYASALSGAGSGGRASPNGRTQPDWHGPAPVSPPPFAPSQPLSAPRLIEEDAIPPWLRGDR